MTVQFPGAPPMNAQWIVFTDLDGTLLNRDSYSFAAAAPALQQLASLQIPLILNSSKTAAEMMLLRQQLDNGDPFVVENGAAVLVPEGYFPAQPDLESLGEGSGYLLKRFSDPHEHILEVLADARHCGFTFAGFSDWSAAELAQKTGLTEQAATLAKQRTGSEPILLEGDLASFQQFLAAFHLRAVQGGRFLHVMGQYDKADGVRWLCRAFAQRYAPTPLYTIALGDSHNDEGMLNAVDCALVIRSPHSADIRLTKPKAARYSEAEGPQGWNELLLPMLQQTYPDDEARGASGAANPDP